MQLKDTQKFSVSVTGRDAKGNVAPFENPQFSVSNPNLGTFEVDPSNPSAGEFKAGAPGSGQLSFTADGIVGEGESVVAAALDITVLPGDAVSAVIDASAVSEQ